MVISNGRLGDVRHVSRCDTRRHVPLNNNRPGWIEPRAHRHRKRFSRMDLPNPDSLKKWIESKDYHDRLQDSYITVIVGLLVSSGIATTEEIQRLRLRAVARLDQMIAGFREEAAAQDETDLRQTSAANKPTKAGEP